MMAAVMAVVGDMLLLDFGVSCGGVLAASSFSGLE